MLTTSEILPVHQLLMSVDGTVDSIEATMATRIAYDNTFDIYDHTRPDKEELAIIKQHDAESFLQNGTVHQRMLDFAKYKVHERYGYNFTEWLENPTWMLELMLEDCKRIYEATKPPPVPSTKK